MGKSVKRVKVLKTKNTRVEVVSVSGKPDCIRIWSQKDTRLEVNCSGVPRGPVPKKGGVPLPQQIADAVTEIGEQVQSWQSMVEAFKKSGLVG